MPKPFGVAYRVALHLPCVLKPDQIQDVLVCFEELGAAAMLLAPFDGFDWKMQAYKGKMGSCYDTGRQVTFKLSAYAALDDDNHILFGQQAICEKNSADLSITPVSTIFDSKRD